MRSPYFDPEYLRARGRYRCGFPRPCVTEFQQRATGRAGAETPGHFPRFRLARGGTNVSGSPPGSASMFEDRGGCLLQLPAITRGRAGRKVDVQDLADLQAHRIDCVRQPHIQCRLGLLFFFFFFFFFIDLPPSRCIRTCSCMGWHAAISNRRFRTPHPRSDQLAMTRLHGGTDRVVCISAPVDCRPSRSEHAGAHHHTGAGCGGRHLDVVVAGTRRGDVDDLVGALAASRHRRWRWRWARPRRPHRRRPCRDRRRS